MDELKIYNTLREIAFKNNVDINSHIANWILKNTEKIKNINLETIAKKTNTSKPSIIRFCNKLGLSGYSELKYQLSKFKKSSLSLNEQFNFQKELIKENNHYLKYLEIKNNSSNLTLEKYILKENEIKKFLKKLEKAKTIYVFGMNLAYNISRNFVQRIRWLNKTVIQERDLNSIESYVEQIDQNDIVIILSLSGSSKHLIDIVKKLESKTFMFGILGEKGEINKYCDLFIDLPNLEENIWDSFSIRGQCLIQILDYLYLDFTNYLLVKVQSDLL
ncbi:MurR/RpiR family transcriptional regulator [Spiroplasma floricola]|uniref:GntR family transcriptional regulator n=1 Tax=Spiroplasma floricola 23-6 TaxID=1336749 RepID=A0A2K8SDQ5_9MOLU|nr:MurR/RpiR family transcriptional regulator [Spiroplasma floricola]AUB31562.1 GntR family transcriptional regulator [Spiroplasma floricola 23-6]